MNVQIPHLALPVRLSGKGLALTEQDSVEEIRDCVSALLRTQIGQRIELPAYGVEIQEFRQDGLDEAGIRDAIGEWEPRAAYTIDGGPSVADVMSHEFQIELEGRSGAGA